MVFNSCSRVVDKNADLELNNNEVIEEMNAVSSMLRDIVDEIHGDVFG